jgi:hypothetical protein
MLRPERQPLPQMAPSLPLLLVLLWRPGQGEQVRPDRRR